ncbi:SH3 domain-containing protein [Herminiimonas sp. CN]|uniref:SH3 domain-containing protein n=1 Tax=Herminiimonas sp. CN TaxID=1349818 RepID=UPI0004742058|nr:SH3 domain-containing protein [Herminiimonas sp. CN]
MKIAVCAVCLGLMVQAGTAQAADFKSVAAAPAILYDAPSVRGTKLFIAPRNMPLEVILSYGNWVKVRDAGGDLSWIEAGALSEQRWVVVSVANARVRASQDEAASVVFSADKNVLLELLAPAASGWVRVRHRDGPSGYVKASEVWGE